jgi:hypothetical protein
MTFTSERQAIRESGMLMNFEKQKASGSIKMLEGVKKACPTLSPIS